MSYKSITSAINEILGKTNTEKREGIKTVPRDEPEGTKREDIKNMARPGDAAPDSEKSLLPKEGEQENKIRNDGIDEGQVDELSVQALHSYTTKAEKEQYDAEVRSKKRRMGINLALRKTGENKYSQIYPPKVRASIKKEEIDEAKIKSPPVVTDTEAEELKNVGKSKQKTQVEISPTLSGEKEDHESRIRKWLKKEDVFSPEELARIDELSKKIEGEQVVKNKYTAAYRGKKWNGLSHTALQARTLAGNHLGLKPSQFKQIAVKLAEDKISKEFVQGDDISDFNKAKKRAAEKEKCKKEETLDEVSKKTLGSYVGKAAKNLDKAARLQGVWSKAHLEYWNTKEKTAKSREDLYKAEKTKKAQHLSNQYEKWGKVADKRLTGIQRASKKLSKEETQPIDEFFIPPGEAVGWRKEFQDRDKAKADKKKADKEKQQKEENLDELSARTLGSYINKAAEDRETSRSWKAKERYTKYAGKKKWNAALPTIKKRLKNRKKGIARAVTRLSEDREKTLPNPPIIKPDEKTKKDRADKFKKKQDDAWERLRKNQPQKPFNEAELTGVMGKIHKAINPIDTSSFKKVGDYTVKAGVNKALGAVSKGKLGLMTTPNILPASVTTDYLAQNKAAKDVVKKGTTVSKANEENELFSQAELDRIDELSARTLGSYIKGTRWSSESKPDKRTGVWNQVFGRRHKATPKDRGEGVDRAANRLAGMIDKRSKLGKKVGKAGYTLEGTHALAKGETPWSVWKSRTDKSQSWKDFKGAQTAKTIGAKSSRRLSIGHKVNVLDGKGSTSPSPKAPEWKSEPKTYEKVVRYQSSHQSPRTDRTEVTPELKAKTVGQGKPPTAMQKIQRAVHGNPPPPTGDAISSPVPNNLKSSPARSQASSGGPTKSVDDAKPTNKLTPLAPRNQTAQPQANKISDVTSSPTSKAVGPEKSVTAKTAPEPRINVTSPHTGENRSVITKLPSRLKGAWNKSVAPDRQVSEEMINELSSDTLKSYVKKAERVLYTKAAKNIYKGKSQANSKKANLKVKNRIWGTWQARTKLTGSPFGEETLDELSKDTLWKYRDKAIGDRRKIVAQMRSGKKDKEVGRKAKNRTQGIKRADDRLKEETINELSRGTLQNYVSGAEKKLGRPKFAANRGGSNWFTQAHRKRVKQVEKGIDMANKKLSEMNEDQIDELSARTLSHYVKDASSAIYDLGRKGEDKKAFKRWKGITQAVGQLGKSKPSPKIQGFLGRADKPTRYKKTSPRIQGFLGREGLAFDYSGDHSIGKIYEGRARGPLQGHPYHDKTDDELKYIAKDAGEAARAMQGHDPKAEGKYADQVNDAATILAHRRRMKKEEFSPEELARIDEISKETLGSYVKSASLDRGLRMVMTGGTTGETRSKFAKKAASRQKGIENAVDRLSGNKILYGKKGAKLYTGESLAFDYTGDHSIGKIYEASQRAKAHRQAWMGEFQKHVVSQDSKHAGKIEWDTANHFHNTGLGAKEAADKYVTTRKDK